ncbi:RNA ligase (ATP) [Patescibacteria group bacterium]|nr:RNA ligase (ATP) [Patescibacteria group bacterium]
MKRKLVSVQKIKKITPIEGADKIEVAQVKGWEVVVQKGLHEEGDNVIYFEIDSFLPVKPEYEFLLRGSSPKKMFLDGEEVEGIRLKTIKLRGQISQGLVMPLEDKGRKIGEELTKELGVLKYEQPISPSLAGKVKGSFPEFIPKTDEERIQNMEYLLGGFYVTEKLDGTSTTFYKKDNQLGVCSKNLELMDSGQTQWKIAKELELEKNIPDGISIQGELVGEGIQKNPLKLSGIQFFCFNVFSIDSGVYLDFEDFVKFCYIRKIEIVPVVITDYSLPNSMEEILEHAEGKSILGKDCEREGIVVRPKIELKHNKDRLSFKVISNKYLLK